MNDLTKIGASHLSRAAYVYLRQSTAAQVEHNRESTQRQYALAAKATALGWPAQQVVVIDEDLGLSGSGVVERSGFARLTAEVALRHVGIVLGLEVSRLARNNADWYRLLDLCGLTDTLIGDADGVYHPAMFNDRLLLGLKGTMSEAELHVLRARLLGGIRNKAARGELRRGLPVGFVWGEQDGEVLFHPDEAVCSAIRTVFARFAELGSVRRVWLWLRTEGLSFPMQTRYGGGVRWVDPSYIAVYHVLTNPVYAGAYAYGKSRHEVTLDACGARKKRTQAATGAMVRAPPHPPSRLHRLEHVREQSCADHGQHSSATASVRRRCRERRKRFAARARRLRTMRTQVAHALHRPHRVCGLSLRWQEHRQWPRHLLPQHWRRASRRGGGAHPAYRARAARC
jgi:DNA invertase Pin-like site-specific DNA recombinase